MGATLDETLWWKSNWIIVIIIWLPLLEFSAPKVTLLQLLFSLDANFTKRGIVEKEWEPSKKTLQLHKEN